MKITNMKKMIITLATVVVFSATALAQPEIEFEKSVHNFGDIKRGDPASVEFTFTNTGNEPLIIQAAEGSCGCTVADYPKLPIQPGSKYSILVNYDSKRIGPINRSVKVTSNGSAEPVSLYIKGTVLNADSAPVKPLGSAPAAK